MSNFVSTIESVNGALNSFAWGPLMLLLLVGTGIYLTVRVNWLQVTHFGRILKNTVGTLFKKQDSKDHGANISPFQAVTTALAGTVGTGNIAGVTGAIFTGGAGAVFWMWVAAFFGMITKYAEILLAMKYRIKDENGVYHGGPMYYIENGIGKSWKWLAVIFCLLGGFASFGIGNIAQSSEISGALTDLFKLPPLASGILIAVVVALVTLGGIKRIGKVTSLLVP
ncbi:MAG: sodium:alanine symporter family protein, partial [Oscillospiraceae bacterium]|nr:sodium:alanine symporter family protein [Oscillospiraceae bacterium]